jgi:hypothetical protein
MQKLATLTVAAACSAGWRATLPIHPAAELFPLMPSDERKELAEDIKKNGLITPLAVWRADSDSPDSPLQLLDGRNRLDAIETAFGSPVRVKPPDIETANGPVAAVGERVMILPSSVDPWAYVVSVNVKRRHLTAKQKRELIAKLLKAQPEKSDRHIGAMAMADGKTAGSVRRELEGRAEIPHVARRKDRKGRGQPARKTAKTGKAAEGKTSRNPKQKPRSELNPKVEKAISAVKGLLKPFSASERKAICERAIANLPRDEVAAPLARRRKKK